MKHISVFLLLLLPGVLALGQDEPSRESNALNLTIGNTGVSFGNAPRVNGLRLNWSDSGLEMVNGINFTLWKPSSKNLSGDINGIALGLVAPGADRIRGIGLSPGAVLAGTSMEGINIGGLAVVSQGSIAGFTFGGLAAVGQGDINGITLTGLAAVSQGSVTGISIGGLATVAQGSVTGITLATLATVAQGDVSGISFGGLATVAQGNVTGFSIGGLATVGQGDVTGFSFGGLAVVSQGEVTGFSIGGAAVVGQRAITGITATFGQLRSDGSITGLNLAGYKIDGRTVNGVNLGLIWTETENIGFLTVGGYNRTYDTQTGLTIGLFNHAHNLAGIQIGLINYVESNPYPFRILPIINVKF